MAGSKAQNQRGLDGDLLVLRGALRVSAPNPLALDPAAEATEEDWEIELERV